jgi:hypothetical protein
MRIALLLLTLLMSQNAFSSTLKLNYSLFFGYMKTMYKLDYQDVTTAFYLIDPSSGENCAIEQAEMVVDNKREAIDFQTQGRLLPFYSDQHRKDGALIEVQTVQQQACALQVTLMAKESRLNALTFEKLVSISEQLEGVLRKNAGMIGKYFLPTYQGLRFKLAESIEPSSQLDMGYQLASNGDLLITNEALKTMDSSDTLSYKVLRITPWILK